jgi:hypothetical protein
MFATIRPFAVALGMLVLLQRAAAEDGGNLGLVLEAFKAAIPTTVEINSTLFDISLTDASYTSENNMLRLQLNITDHFGASVTDAIVMLSYSSYDIQQMHKTQSALAPGWLVLVPALQGKYYNAGEGYATLPTYYADVNDHELLLATGSAQSVDYNTGEEILVTQCNIVWSDDEHISILSSSVIKQYGYDFATNIARYLVNFTCALF